MLLNKISDPKLTETPQEDCNLFEKVFNTNSYDLSDFRTKQSQAIQQIAEKRSRSVVKDKLSYFNKIGVSITTKKPSFSKSVLKHDNTRTETDDGQSTKFTSLGQLYPSPDIDQEANNDSKYRNGNDISALEVRHDKSSSLQRQAEIVNIGKLTL
jgi:hypothetical protein